MTSYYQSPYYLESCCRYPYVGKKPIRKKATVDFVYQFVKKEIVTHNTFYAGDIIGIPTKFYQNSLMRYSDITKSPCLDQTLMNKRQVIKYKIRTDNNIDIEFHEAVYPIRVCIYEIFVPGTIIKIWAQNSDNNEWVLLWKGLPQILSCPHETRLFSPLLRSCNFKTKRLRLEECGYKLNFHGFHTVLDAVMLIGSSELGIENNVHMYSVEFQFYLNSPTFFEFTESAFMCSTVGRTFQNNEKFDSDQNNLEYKQLVDSSKNNWHHRKCDMKYKSFAAESKKLSRCNLSALPDEIILKIFKNLDLMSLCRMNQVNERFNNLTLDPRLYTCLTMRYVVYMDSTNVFSYFTPRCKYLQELDLTSSEFFSKDFVEFLNDCGSHLTCLRLSECLCVNEILLKISEICENLKELDLSKCKIVNKAFLHLEKLRGLEYLNLSSTCLLPLVQSLCKILQKNQRMRELHLKDVMIDLDPIIIELKNSCPDLQVLNLQYAIHYQKTLPGKPIIFDILADCKNLRKVNLQINYSILDHFGRRDEPSYFELGDSLNRFLSSCQYLEELHLSELILTDRNFELLSQCKNLENLHFFDMGYRDPNKCTIIFEHCPKLQQFYITSEISEHLIKKWKERYPHVYIHQIVTVNKYRPYYSVNTLFC